MTKDLRFPWSQVRSADVPIDGPNYLASYPSIRQTDPKCVGRTDTLGGIGYFDCNGWKPCTLAAAKCDPPDWSEKWFDWCEPRASVIIPIPREQEK